MILRKVKALFKTPPNSLGEFKQYCEYEKYVGKVKND